MDKELIKILRRVFKPEEGLVPSAPFDYLHEFGNVHSALLYSILFVPNFVEMDGSILIEMDREKGFPEAKRAADMDLAELEASFNFIEVPYIFSDRGGVDSDYVKMTEVIAEAWRARLRYLFPSRTFIVSVLSPSETGGGIGVQFYEAR